MTSLKSLLMTGARAIGLRELQPVGQEQLMSPPRAPPKPVPTGSDRLAE
jgi:hypothetical protein